MNSAWLQSRCWRARGLDRVGWGCTGEGSDDDESWHFQNITILLQYRQIRGRADVQTGPIRAEGRCRTQPSRNQTARKSTRDNFFFLTWFVSGFDGELHADDLWPKEKFLRRIWKLCFHSGVCSLGRNQPACCACRYSFQQCWSRGTIFTWKKVLWNTANQNKW